MWLLYITLISGDVMWSCTVFYDFFVQTGFVIFISVACFPFLLTRIISLNYFRLGWLTKTSGQDRQDFVISWLPFLSPSQCYWSTQASLEISTLMLVSILCCVTLITLYFLFIVLRSVQVESSCAAVQWVSRVGVCQQLWQKWLEYVWQIYMQQIHTALL